MIKVLIKNNNRNISEINISGHAQSVKPGKNDLVCAAMSGIVVGFFNGLAKSPWKNDVEMKITNKQSYLIVKQQSSELEHVLNIFINQIKTLQDAKPKNINIEGDVQNAI